MNRLFANSDGHSVDPAASPVRRVALVAVCLAGALGFWLARDWLRWEVLAEHEAGMREFQQQSPGLAFGIAAAVYYLVTAFSIPGSLILTFLYAWYFGFWPTAVLVSFASTAGATSAFWISRYLLRDYVTRKYGGHLGSLQAALDREGAYLLLTLRLLPTVPFVLVNAVMGLTNLSTRTFWWGSQLGMLPATLIYSFAGSRVPSLEQLARHGIAGALSPGEWTQCAMGLTLLAVLPWGARLVVARMRGKAA